MARFALLAPAVAVLTVVLLQADPVLGDWQPVPESDYPKVKGYLKDIFGSSFVRRMNFMGAEFQTLKEGTLYDATYTDTERSTSQNLLCHSKFIVGFERLDKPEAKGLDCHPYQ